MRIRKQTEAKAIIKTIISTLDVKIEHQEKNIFEYIEDGFENKPEKEVISVLRRYFTDLEELEKEKKAVVHYLYARIDEIDTIVKTSMKAK